MHLELASLHAEPVERDGDGLGGTPARRIRAAGGVDPRVGRGGAGLERVASIGAGRVPEGVLQGPVGRRLAAAGGGVTPAAGGFALGVVALRRAGVLDEALPLDVEAGDVIASGAELEQRVEHRYSPVLGSTGGRPLHVGAVWANAF